MFVCFSGTFSFKIVMITQVLVQTFTTTGKTTNSITYFCVTFTHILVKSFNTRGKYCGATLPVSKLEQGDTWCHWSSSRIIFWFDRWVPQLYSSWGAVQNNRLVLEQQIQDIWLGCYEVGINAMTKMTKNYNHALRSPLTLLFLKFLQLVS